MSPLNRGPLLGSRVPPTGVRPLPPPNFGVRLVPPGMPPRMPPPPINPVFGGPGPMRQRLPPPPRPVGASRPNGLLPFFPGPRARGMAPGIVAPMGPRGAGVPRGPLMRPWPRRIPPPQMMPPNRPRFTAGNCNVKGKPMSNTKKVNKLEELELKKPWMTDEIRSEIQKKNKLYAKAKKNKDAVEWEEFKDLRNKVTRMIRDAKNEYFTKHPEQARLYPDEEPYDQRDENYLSSEDDISYYCEICDRDFASEDAFTEHKSTHKFCGIDGCTFSAHPLLIEKHISMQHSTGLYQRMKNFSTPEDIEKWLMERKKKYPTKANIELRKAEELEKLQRGEIIKQNSNVQTKIRKITNMHEKKRKPRKRHTRETNNNNFHIEKIYRGLRPFPGTSTLQEDSNEVCLIQKLRQIDLCEDISGNISDEDDVPQASVEFKLTNLPIPVTSLVANYESEADEDEIPEEMPIKRMKMEDLQDHKITEHNTIQEEISNDTQTYTDASNKSNKQTKADKISRHSIAKHHDKQKHQTNRIVKDKRNEKIFNRHHNKLLQKLLSRSIQHERNLICQCLRYIVDNNFFDLS